MHRRKAALTMIFQSLFCACACGIQFWIYGYSLYQSRATNPFLGNASLAALHNVLAQPSLANSDIPDILYACFGFTFVTATAMILAGAMLERGRLWPSMLFLLCWTTFVYYVLAYFEWNPNGWLYKLGVYDFAGSGPVHIASGFSALAWSIMLGPRIGDSTIERRKSVVHFKPHNPFLVGLGTCFIWFGWFAFNGASTANLSLRSIYVVVNTNLAACGGGIGWVLLEYFYSKKFSIIGFCSGIISGLVGITPAAGFGKLFLARSVELQLLMLHSPCIYRRPRWPHDIDVLLFHEQVQVSPLYRRRPRYIRHPWRRRLRRRYAHRLLRCFMGTSTRWCLRLDLRWWLVGTQLDSNGLSIGRRNDMRGVGFHCFVYLAVCHQQDPWMQAEGR